MYESRASEPCLRPDQYFGPAQADPALPGSISSIWGLCSLHRRLSISKHKLVLRISDHRFALTTAPHLRPKPCISDPELV